MLGFGRPSKVPILQVLEKGLHAEYHAYGPILRGEDVIVSLIVKAFVVPWSKLAVVLGTFSSFQFAGNSCACKWAAMCGFNGFLQNLIRQTSFHVIAPVLHRVRSYRQTTSSFLDRRLTHKDINKVFDAISTHGMALLATLLVPSTTAESPPSSHLATWRLSGTA